MLLRLRCDVERVWACDIRQYVQADNQIIGYEDSADEGVELEVAFFVVFVLVFYVF